MCDTAFEYAGRHGLIRTNEIHGEQEAKLVLSEGFNYEEEDLEVRQSCQRLTVKVSRLTHCCRGDGFVNTNCSVPTRYSQMTIM